MKNIRFALAILLLGFSAVSLTTCGGGGSSSSGTLNFISTPVVMPVGANQQFTAFGGYSDGTNQTTQVSWASSNTSVVTVTGSGRATALAAGTVTITATSGSISGSTPLTVNSVALSSITVTPANPNPLPAGVGQQFVAIGTYSDGTSHDITTQVTWSSSNPSVATVGLNTGLATGVAAGGPVAIIATSGSVSGHVTLTVSSVILSTIAVTPTNPSIPVGVAQQFTATGTYSDNTTHDISTLVTWISSNPSVATVGLNTGLATAVAAGTTAITATLGSISSLPTTTLTVTSASLSSIFVAPTIHVGTIQQFMALGAFSDGSTQNVSDQVSWTSSLPSVATISNTGVATALSAGSTGIAATVQPNFSPTKFVQTSTTLVVLP